MKSSIRNAIVSIFLLSSALFFGWLFRNELNKTAEFVDGIVVGEIVEIRGQVQRRFNRQSKWDSIFGDEEIFNLDSIRTAGDSNALIFLRRTDGEGNEVFDEIALGSNTYIVFDLLGSMRSVNLVGGKLSAKGQQGLTISAEGALVYADRGLVNLNSNLDDQLSVSVSEGEATVLINEQRTQVGRDAILQFDKNSGKATRLNVAVAADKPSSNALLLSYETEVPVDFAWRVFADWPTSLLEVSTDSTFSNIDGARIRADSGASLNLEPGTWYWRILESEGGESGPINEFSIGLARRIEPIAPTPGLDIPFRGQAPGVSLRWSSAPYASSYTVELSQNSSFSNPQIVREVIGNSILIKALTEGSWWWRVIPRYQRGRLSNPLSSEPRYFVLERRIEHEPTALISPAGNASLSSLDVRDGIPFRWLAADGMVSYRISVARNREMSDIVAVGDGPENWKTLLPAPEAAIYYWRVEAVAADGGDVPPSETRSFTVRPQSGIVELIDPAPGEELRPFTSHSFIWRSDIPGTARFLLSRVGGEDGGGQGRIVDALLQGESFTTMLPGEGEYAWSIQILDDKGRLLLRSGEARFISRAEFRPPELSNPSPGSAIGVAPSNTITIGWNPSPGADAYDIALRNQDGVVVGLDRRVSGLSRDFAFSQEDSEGAYSVELTSIRDNPPPGASARSETATYRFEVRDFVRYSPAIPISPANDSTIDAIEALREGITLSWRQDSPLNNYSVELSNGEFTRVYQSEGPSLSLESLSPGYYSWTVRSRDSFGQEAPRSQVARFRVDDFPSPAPPAVISPRAGVNLDMTGEKNLSFEWQAGKEAAVYDLALYMGNSRVPLIREEGWTDSTYTLENLEILDVGNFTFTIQSRIDYLDIGITRTSAVVRVPFSLSINVADTEPKMLSDELQYAE